MTNSYITKINTISQLYDFASASNLSHKVMVTQSGCTVDGRSILGLLSLDLFSPIVVSISDEDITNFKFLDLKKLSE